MTCSPVDSRGSSGSTISEPGRSQTYRSARGVGARTGCKLHPELSRRLVESLSRESTRRGSTTGQLVSVAHGHGKKDVPMWTNTRLGTFEDVIAGAGDDLQSMHTAACAR